MAALCVLSAALTLLHLCLPVLLSRAPSLCVRPHQDLNENLAKLTAQFEKATADKLKCQQEAESTARTISLANRLVSGGGQGGCLGCVTKSGSFTQAHGHTSGTLFFPHTYRYKCVFA